MNFFVYKGNNATYLCRCGYNFTDIKSVSPYSATLYVTIVLSWNRAPTGYIKTGERVILSSVFSDNLTRFLTNEEVAQIIHDHFESAL